MGSASLVHLHCFFLLMDQVVPLYENREYFRFQTYKLIFWVIANVFIKGGLWISWGYVNDLSVMVQLAMALMVCENTRFRFCFSAVRSLAV